MKLIFLLLVGLIALSKGESDPSGTGNENGEKPMDFFILSSPTILCYKEAESAKIQNGFFRKSKIFDGFTVGTELGVCIKEGSGWKKVVGHTTTKGFKV